MQRFRADPKLKRCRIKPVFCKLRAFCRPPVRIGTVSFSFNP